MKKYILFLTFILLLTIPYNLKAARKQKSIKTNIISFENNVPENFTVLKGELSISRRHAKHKKFSLKWKFSNDDILIIDNPIYLEEASKSRNGGFTFWIYNEIPNLEGKLKFTFLDNKGEEKCHFNYGLNFRGWRTSWIHFREDLKYFDKKSSLSSVKIEAPNNIKRGKVFFDLLEFHKGIVGCRSSDMQFQKPKIEAFAWGTYRWANFKPTIDLEKQISPKQVSDFNKISDRLDYWLLGSDKYKGTKIYNLRKKSYNKYIKRGIKKLKKYKIRRKKNGSVAGKPLFARNSAHSPKMNHGGLSENVCLPLALDYKLNNNRESLDKLIMVLDFMHDQGWDYGSGLGSLDHEINRTAGYMFAVYLIRADLRKAHRLRREIKTIDWYLAFNQCFAEEKYEITADAMRTKYMFHLLRVLTMDNTPKKVQYMKGLLKYYNKGLQIATGWADLIKPDFMGYHHRGVYSNGYCPMAYHNAALIHYILFNTEFDFNRKSISNLKNVLLTQRIISNKYHTPASIGGRLKEHDVLNRILPAYAYMANTELAYGNKKMASVFMRLWDPDSNYLKDQLFSIAGSKISYFHTMGSIEIMLDLASKNITPEKSPKGFWSKPYAGLAVQRRDDWMASAKGWSQYIFDFESGAKDNLYGRYVSYGSLQILNGGNPVDYINSGYNLDNGWNWNRWPGTTTINLPLDELGCKKPKPIHRNFSPSTFLGAVDLGNNGVWGMKLHDTVFQKDFIAYKSLFFIDNEIICLGSGISNSNINYNTETTIFQSFIKEEISSIIVNNDKITSFPYEAIIDNGSTVTILDPSGNGYIIPDSKNLVINKQVQKSKNSSSKKKDVLSVGKYANAYFNHGKAPNEVGYEYSILINTTSEKLNEYVKNIPYTVLQKNNIAHIIKHNTKNITAFSIFNSEKFLGKELLNAVSVPVLVAYEQKGDNITLSICDPDFRRKHVTGTNKIQDSFVFDKGKSQEVEIELKGNWKLNSGNNTAIIKKIENNITTLVINCYDAKSYKFDLSKM